MKKYRFNDPGLKNPLQRIKPYIFIFVGWNLFGYTLWSYVNRKAAQNNPDWEQKSSAEKMATLYGTTGNVEVRKISLLGSKDDK
ncbi:unnamed protein product [Lymnaea stagnalis]|uniref:Uncharacterized protein n=1 Tax=Lymnaea stagnalis TaxID=6523 RepID=A0AAV2HTX1_LYMST